MCLWCCTVCLHVVCAYDMVCVYGVVCVCLCGGGVDMEINTGLHSSLCPFWETTYGTRRQE